MSMFLPISTDVRDFLHRDVHAETKRKLRRMFRQRYSTVEEYDASYGEICGYFMEHMWEKEKDEVIRESDVGKQIKNGLITSKISQLRRILFCQEEEEEEEPHEHNNDEMVPMSEFLAMKKHYADKLLDARDEIVKLHRIIMKQTPPSSNECSQSSPAHSTVEVEIEVHPMTNDAEEVHDSEHVDDTKDINYTEINEILNSLALLREMRASCNANHPVNVEENGDPDIDELTTMIEETKLTDPEDANIKLECPICYRELNTDRESEDYTGCCIGEFCGHALCNDCWKSYRRNRNRICPVCRVILFRSRRGRPPKANVY